MSNHAITNCDTIYHTEIWGVTPVPPALIRGSDMPIYKVRLYFLHYSIAQIWSNAHSVFTDDSLLMEVSLGLPGENHPGETHLP